MLTPMLTPVLTPMLTPSYPKFCPSVCGGLLLLMMLLLLLLMMMMMTTIINHIAAPFLYCLTVAMRGGVTRSFAVSFTSAPHAILILFGHMGARHTFWQSINHEVCAYLFVMDENIIRE